MSDVENVRIISCCAVHDEIEGAKPFSLPHCAGNIICSHGNMALEEAINEGERRGTLSFVRANAMRSIILKTRIQLLQHVDNLAVLKRIFSRGEGDEKKATEEKIAKVLGKDQSLWDEAHAKLQLTVAEPIMQIAKVLEGLGLLHIAPNVVQIRIGKMIAAGRRSASAGINS